MASPAELEDAQYPVKVSFTDAQRAARVSWEELVAHMESQGWVLLQHFGGFGKRG